MIEKIKNFWISIPVEYKIALIFTAFGFMLRNTLGVLDYRTGWMAHSELINMSVCRNDIVVLPDIQMEDLINASREIKK